MVVTEDNKAPGRLELVRRFVNTTDLEGPTDDIVTPETLAAWLTSVDLAPAGLEAGEEDVRRARDLREALRALMFTNHDGADPAPEVLETLNAAASRAPATLRFEGRSATLEPTATGVDAALADLLSIVAEAMSDGTWIRMKACMKESCRWAFYDCARNRSGRWCSMAVCGNRVKAQNYRRKQAPATS